MILPGRTLVPAVVWINASSSNLRLRYNCNRSNVRSRTREVIGPCGLPFSQQDGYGSWGDQISALHPSPWQESDPPLLWAQPLAVLLAVENRPDQMPLLSSFDPVLPESRTTKTKFLYFCKWLSLWYSVLATETKEATPGWYFVKSRPFFCINKTPTDHHYSRLLFPSPPSMSPTWIHLNTR